MPYVSPSPLPTPMATNAVILNTPEAENMAERINVQAATWCHFYWKDTNKGGERFFRKLSERAFNGHLIHEISECTILDILLESLVGINPVWIVRPASRRLNSRIPGCGKAYIKVSKATSSNIASSNGYTRPTRGITPLRREQRG